ncbi:MAG: hypothetical protein CMF52_06820 [Legionellales bacterium]|nr:hypothetical protein [Legionellales bacterium]|tara:strand:- start:2165 stop:2380 length:216 start_codon:yes stop_codon:yes gene_type:complete
MVALKEGDLVACYLTNTETYEELLSWGIVLQVSESLKDLLVLDNSGNICWFPRKRWTKLREEKNKNFTGHL